MSRPTGARRAPAIPNDNISLFLGDLVPDELQGNDRFLDIINWNIRFFNDRDPERVRVITSVLKELNADIFILVEIEDKALDGIAAELTKQKAGLYKTAYGTTGGDQRVAFMYDTELVKASRTIDELFDDEPPFLPDTKKRVFPRLPLHSTFVARDINPTKPAFDFHMVGLHLKSQRGGGEEQREAEAERLMRWVNNETEDEDAILAGDWNALPTRPEFASLRGSERDGKGSRLDLVAVSEAAEDASVEKAAKVIQWRQELMTKANLPETIDRISDHLPVISRFFFTDVD